MKTIGLIGGISWLSTMEYYRLINSHIQKRLGGNHSAQMIIVNLDQEIIDKLANAGAEDKIYQVIEDAVIKLNAAGADFGLLCANGVHRFYSRLVSRNGKFPILHIADATAKAIQRANLRKVGLLGIKKTMEGEFYRSRLLDNGIECLIPDASDRDIIDKIIFTELTRGIFTENSRHLFLEIMQKLFDKGGEGVILGCTEIPLLVNQSDTKIPLFSTTELHCIAGVDYALS